MHQRRGEFGKHLALLRVNGLAGILRHHEGGNDALEHRDFRPDLARHDDVRSEADEAPAVLGTGGLHRCGGESTDQLAGEVLEATLRHAAAVPVFEPDVEGIETVEGGNELVVVELAPDPGKHRIDEGIVVDPCSQRLHVDVAAHHGILEVMHRVGDVIGEVHHLRFDAQATIRGVGPQPEKGVDVVGVEAELGSTTGIADRGALRPRILAARVETRPGEVEAVGAAVRTEDLRFDSREQAQRLGVALEPADVGGPVVERSLTIVAKGRMPQVVSETRRVDDIRV